MEGALPDIDDRASVGTSVSMVNTPSLPLTSSHPSPQARGPFQSTRWVPGLPAASITGYGSVLNACCSGMTMQKIQTRGSLPWGKLGVRGSVSGGNTSTQKAAGGWGAPQMVLPSAGEAGLSLDQTRAGVGGQDRPGRLHPVWSQLPSHMRRDGAAGVHSTALGNGDSAGQGVDSGPLRIRDRTVGTCIKRPRVQRVPCCLCSYYCGEIQHHGKT